MGFFFDDSATEDRLSGEYFEPLWTIDTTDEQAVLEWGKKAAHTLHEIYQPLNHIRRMMACAYRGYYYGTEPVVGGKRIVAERSASKKEFPRVVTQHLRSLVEQKVAMQVKYRPETEPYPFSNETKDKYGAMCAKKFLKSVKDANKMDLKWPVYIRRAIVTGEAFLFPEWNEYIGDKDGKKVKKVTYPGKDQEFTVEVPVRKGDIHISSPLTENVFLFPAIQAADCQGLMRIDYIDLWQLRAQYPHLADDIIATDNIDVFDYNTLEDSVLANHVAVATFYIRPNCVCDQGLMFRMTPTTILKHKQEKGEAEQPFVYDLPIPREGTDSFEFGNIPVVRLTDDEFDWTVNGFPSIATIVGQQQLYDSLTTQFAMNVAMYCHPKWAFQKGTVSINQLANIPGLFVEHTSNEPPKLLLSNALTQDQFIFRDSVLQNMEKTFGVFSVSRGAPPPGTRATSQLYFYDEQEQQLNAPFKRKFDSCVESLDALLLPIMGEHYTGDKERVVWILGQDNKWVAETLDTTVLKKRYSIRVKAGSNLPDSKSARLNAVFELYGMNPNAVTWNMLMEMLDFGQQEKYIDYARVSVLAAEAENELLMAGREVASPAPYELHVDHMKVHYKLLHSPEFKQQPEDIQLAIREHVGAHEMLALQIGQKNPVYAQQLQMMGQFPLIATEPVGNPEQPAVPPIAAPARPVGRPPGSGGKGGPPAGALAPDEGMGG